MLPVIIFTHYYTTKLFGIFGLKQTNLSLQIEVK